MTPIEWPQAGSLAFDSRDAFQAAVRALIGLAGARGARELVLCDPDFADWPLGEPAVLAALSAWALPHRRMVLLARHFDHFDRAHPRWVAWRRQWGHVVECRAADEQDADGLPSVLVAPPLGALRRADALHWRGWCYSEPNDIRRCTEMVDAALQRGSPSFPVTQLGL